MSGSPPAFAAQATETAALLPVSRLPSYGTLLPAPSDLDQDGGDESDRSSLLESGKEPERRRTHIDRWTLCCLLLQHISSTSAASLYLFATFIFLVEVYKDTLAPASFLGLFTTTAGFIFSGSVGAIVDRTPRLRFVRWSVAIQKLLIAGNIALFLLLFGPLKDIASRALHDDCPWEDKAKIYSILLLTNLSSACIYVVNIGINVAVERDWVTTIAQGDPECLTKLNAYMSAIDRLCRIVGPMIVSAFTMTLGNIGAVKAIIFLVLLCGIAEYSWIQVVYDRFPILRHDEQRHLSSSKLSVVSAESQPGDGRRTPQAKQEGRWAGLRDESRVWRDFVNMPIFLTSMASALTWLTVLHLDATGVAHFKIAAGYSDLFLALIRGVCMILSIVGTVIYPMIERTLGYLPAGIAGLSAGIFCFICTTIAFFVEPLLGQSSSARTANTIVMFSGIILARAGHTVFDLAQIKAIQLKLEHHPERNRLTAMQSSLQSFFALVKFASTMVFSAQNQFKWTVLITLLANFAAWACYMAFLRRERTVSKRLT